MSNGFRKLDPWDKETGAADIFIRINKELRKKKWKVLFKSKKKKKGKKGKKE